MFLAIDVGNTHIVVGLFESENLRHVWRISSDAARTEDEYRVILIALLQEQQINLSLIRGSMVSSGIPRLTQTMSRTLHKLLGVEPMILAHSLDLGMANLYQRPEDVGPDRIADAVGGIARYGAPLIVVDFGTATTFNIVSRNAEYLGGIIMPGLEMSADALYQRTARLPRIAIAPPKSVIGRSTLEAIDSGLIWGTAAAVDRLIVQIRNELAEPDCPAIATGGHADLIAQRTEFLKQVDRDLTLYGMLKIWQRNFGPVV